MTERWLAVLGARDEPCDAVEEYCRYLSGVLSDQGVQLELYRVPWASAGWQESLEELDKKADEAQASWCLVQYTALAWSRRGFPFRVLQVIATLKKKGIRCVVVFHDPDGYPGERIVDRVRRQIQRYVMRRIVERADVCVSTIAVERLEWLCKQAEKVAFIPVGANLPHPERAWEPGDGLRNSNPTVAVFSLGDGKHGQVQVERISAAVRYASGVLGSMRVMVLGRNSEIGGKRLRETLGGTQAEVLVHGFVNEEEIIRLLSRCDVMLFVRGPISTRRGSALAGIACGLPVVAWEGWETAATIQEAGVVLLPGGSVEEFGPALVRVLQDDEYRNALRERSRQAQTKYFSWDRIAAQFVKLLSEARS